jgi:hypothetical protein
MKCKICFCILAAVLAIGLTAQPVERAEGGINILEEVSLGGGEAVDPCQRGIILLPDTSFSARRSGISRNAVHAYRLECRN